MLPRLCLDTEGWGPFNRHGSDLTHCFEYAALFLLPSAVAMSAFVYQIYRWKHYSTPHRFGRTAWIYWPTQIMMALSSLILFAYLAWQLGFNPASENISPIVILGVLSMAVAWATALPVNHAAHQYTVRSCSVIFAFNVISIIAVLLALHTSLASSSSSYFALLSKHPDSTTEPDQYFLTALLVTLTIGFMVEALPRGKTNVVRLAAESGVNIYDRSNLFARLSFHFLQPIMALAAAKKTLDKADIGNMLPDTVRAEYGASVLARAWNARLSQFRQRHPKTNNGADQEAWQPDDYPRHMLFWTLLSTHRWDIVPAIILRIATSLNMFVGPALMSLLLDYIEGTQEGDDKQEKKSHVYGITIAFGMLIAAIGGAVVYSYNTRWMMLTGQRIKSALSSMIYQKALKISPGARQASSVGRMNNLLVVDTDTWQHAIDNLSVLFAIPLEVALALYMIYQLVGWTVLVGVATILAMVPIQLWRAKNYEELEDKILKAKDERVRLITQVLSSIKVIKLYNWEKPFERRVQEARQHELDIYKKQGQVEAIISLVFASASTLITLTTLSAYAAWGGPNFTPGKLTAKTVFVTMTVNMMMHGPLSRLSELTADVITISVAARRMQRFLLLEELDANEVLREQEQQGKPVVELKEATCSWARPDGQKVAGLDDGPDDDDDEDDGDDGDKDEEGGVLEAQPLLSSADASSGAATSSAAHPSQEGDGIEVDTPRLALENITLSIRKGELTAIVGRVGSGKSTLLSAIIGETYRISGEVIVRGNVAYVPQQAWIINATVRNNIVFGLPFDQAKYDKIVFSCGLEPDLAMLPAGDQTEIGERGINLSGGQKQRVSLARAAYADADNYLLDDPLSAVDAHVDKHLWIHLLGPEGLLKNKTRILVTHGIHHLKSMDKIVVLREGHVVENGTYPELMAAKQSFYSLIKEYSIEHRRHHLVHRKSSDGAHVSTGPSNDTLKVPSGGTQEVSGGISDTESTRSILHDLDEEDQVLLEEEGDGDSTTAEGDLASDSMGSKKAAPADNEDGEDEDEDEDGQLISDEYNKKGGIDWGLVMDYVRAVSYKNMFIFEGLMVLAQVFWVLTSLWLMHGINSSKESNSGGSSDEDDDDGKDFNVAWFLVVFALLSLSYVFTSMLSLWMCFAVGRIRAAKVIHTALLENVMRLPMSFFDTTPLGRIINRFSSDMYNIDEHLPWRFMDIAYLVTSFALSMIVVTYVVPVVLIVFPLMVICYYFIQDYYMWASRSLKRILSSAKSPVYSNFNETLDGLASIRAMQVQERYIENNEERVDHFANCFVAYFQTHEWLSLRLESLQALMGFTCAVFAVYARDILDPALVGLVLMYTLTMDEDMTWLMRVYGGLQNELIAMERVKEYTFDKKTEAPAITDSHIHLPPQWPAKGGIEFVDYSTRYREGLDLVLKHVSFKVAPGEKVGIVGRTGAGKSSLTLALFRIVEAANSYWAKASDNTTKKNDNRSADENDGNDEERQSLLDNAAEVLDPDLEIDGGKILIDGIDISTLGLDDLRHRLAIIPQDPTLFSGTVRENLDPFGERVLDADLWEALERAHLKDHVSSLPGGLNFKVSQNGENFSVGQRSLLCLARALLRKTKILVLDEATSSVDVQTDELIQQTIRTEFKDRTILTIAHRIKTVMDSDKILVLEKGCVVEFASPRELLQQETSLFRQLAVQAGEI